MLVTVGTSFESAVVSIFNTEIEFELIVVFTSEVAVCVVRWQRCQLLFLTFIVKM